MNKVAKFLWINYYPEIPASLKQRLSLDTLTRNLVGLRDKMLIYRQGRKIKAVAIYLTLSDATFADLRANDLTTENLANTLAREHGPNVHFIMVAGGGFATLRLGIEEVKRRLSPKTISWFSTDSSKLFKIKTGE